MSPRVTVNWPGCRAFRHYGRLLYLAPQVTFEGEIVTFPILTVPSVIAEAMVPCDLLGNAGIRGRVVGRVRDLLTAHRLDGDRLPCSGDIWPHVAWPGHGLDHGRAIRDLAVKLKLRGPDIGRSRKDRRVEVGGRSRHVLEGVAELAVVLVEPGIRDELHPGLPDQASSVNSGTP